MAPSVAIKVQDNSMMKRSFEPLFISIMSLLPQLIGD